MIDLRSDTVTRPGPEMLEAMMHARVGDDVFSEDPTINELQEFGAELFGHEAGLFCPSGTMTNQIAIAVHTRPGDEVICHEQSHVYNYEGGGIARNSNASTRLVHNGRSTMTPEEVNALVHPVADWLARTSLVVAEDTSNRGGGKCYTLQELEALSTYCRNKNLGFHLDGARAFNAIVKQNHDTRAYGKLFDSVSICLSKGLGAPVGSLLLGSRDFIREARRVRKVMGGGMRQAGYLAAAGIFALKNNVNRLEADHENAKTIAEEIANARNITGIIEPETNILLFDVNPSFGAEFFLEKLEKAGVRAVKFGANRIRIVTHLDVSRKEVIQAGRIIHEVMDRSYEMAGQSSK